MRGQRSVRFVSIVARLALVFGILLFVGMSLQPTMVRASESVLVPSRIVYFIVDGMGFEQLELARINRGGSLAVDSFPAAGSVSTYAADDPVTDSAAAGTALASGVKTNLAHLGVTPEGRPVTTLLEAAQRKGWATGLVTTTRITHATPAAFVAKVRARTDEDEIARQMLEARPDVLLGGGYAVMQPVLERMADLPYRVLTNRDELLHHVATGDSARPILGLFADDHMTYELLRDPANEPSLAEMTVAALTVLDRNSDGFFVMIEAGRVDHAGHDNLTAEAILEMVAFDDAMRATLDWMGTRDDVLVVVTADHETGGMKVAESARSEVIQDPYGLAALTEQIMEQLTTMSPVDVDAVFAPYDVDLEAGLPLLLARRPTPTLIRRALQQYIGVYWATVSHTAQDVPLFALGPGAEYFAGEQDNTDVARRIAELAGLSIGQRGE